MKPSDSPKSDAASSPSATAPPFGVPTLDAAAVRWQFAGIERYAPRATFDEDHRRCADRLCVVLAAFYNVSSSRLLLWEHVAKAVDLALARARDPEVFVSEAIRNVRGDMTRRDRADLAAKLIGDLRGKDAAWLAGFYDYLRLATAAWVVRGMRAWSKRWRRSDDSPSKLAFDLRRAFDADPLAADDEDAGEFPDPASDATVGDPTRETATY